MARTLEESLLEQVQALRSKIEEVMVFLKTVLPSTLIQEIRRS